MGPGPPSKPVTAAKRRSAGTEATRSAPTFKTAAEREGCVVPKVLYQHREATSYPSSQVGAPLSQRSWGSFRKKKKKKKKPPGLLR